MSTLISPTSLPDPQPSVPAGWRSAAITKFQTPRLRREVVERPDLVGRLWQMALDCRVTLVQAPAGFGKSTLLSQLAAQARQAQDADRCEVVWASLDADDSDANRLFVSLLAALQNVALEWAIDPQTLASQVHDASPQSRAALSVLVNALSSYQGERLIVILDDLHRVSDADALQLLDALAERLPPEVGLVIGSRTVPDLSLARWRALGELGELLTADLQFNEQEAASLAHQHMADRATAEFVRLALGRTSGWAAGLRLVFGSARLHPPTSSPPGGPLPDTALDRTAHRHLFDFFAHEVLSELPTDLREFILQCSVLTELRPEPCQALTGRTDSPQMLDDLYRRNLFLTVLDDAAPVLKFHDLFLDFLRAELDRKHPGQAPALHAKAAQVEPIPSRAVSHWLQAGCWPEAIAAMHDCAPALLAEGGHALVEKWIRQLPADQALRYPEVAHLQGLCSWSRYDYLTMLAQLNQACQGFLAQGRHDQHAQTLILLAWLSNYVGDTRHSGRLLAQAEHMALPPEQQVTVIAARAWHAAASGQPGQVALHLQKLADALEADATWLFPAVSDLFNGIFYGLPGTLAPLKRLRDLCAKAMARQPSVHWQVGALATSPWPEFWAGDEHHTDTAVRRHRAFNDQWSFLHGLSLDAAHVKSWFSAALADQSAETAAHTATLQAMDSGPLNAMTRSWRRVVVLNMLRHFWVRQDVAGFLPHLPDLQAPRQPEEWPCVEAALWQVRGQVASLNGELEQAQALLAQAVTLTEQQGLPGFFGQPRLSLAMVQMALGQPEQAWRSFEPLWRQCLDEDSIGAWLVEPRGPMRQLLDAIPRDERQAPQAQALLTRFAQWPDPASTATSASPAVPRTSAQAGTATAALSILTDRELQVLERIAVGDSNKLIARALDLSPHTVKRHVANLLGKIDCGTRGQAAAWWRAHQG